MKVDTVVMVLMILQAIERRGDVRIDYTDGEGGATTRVISPQQLIFTDGNRWKVEGYCKKRGTFRSFRLDRISSVDDSGMR